MLFLQNHIKEHIMVAKAFRAFGLTGAFAFLSYASMVFFSPLAYPGYDWMTMAVSELSASGAAS